MRGIFKNRKMPSKVKDMELLIRQNYLISHKDAWNVKSLEQVNSMAYIKKQIMKLNSVKMQGDLDDESIEKLESVSKRLHGTYSWNGELRKNPVGIGSKDGYFLQKDVSNIKPATLPPPKTPFQKQKRQIASHRHSSTSMGIRSTISPRPPGVHESKESRYKDLCVTCQRHVIDTQSKRRISMPLKAPPSSPEPPPSGSEEPYLTSITDDLSINEEHNDLLNNNNSAWHCEMKLNNGVYTPNK